MSTNAITAGDGELKLPPRYDRWLLLAAVVLVCFGLLMLTSASMVIAERHYGEPFHFVIRQLCHLGLGIGLMMLVLQIEVKRWFEWSPYLLIASLVMLLLVLVPGLSREVNGGRRWLHLGFISFQAAEFAKLGIFTYLAGYLVRRQDEVREDLFGFLKPMMLLAVIASLLLLQPDFGTSVVVLSASMGMLFLAGVKLWPLLSLIGLGVVAMAGLIVSSPYRLARLTGFLHPWANQFDSGYQLTQSLIAFGRGGWSGVGLGGSIQKLLYLPEAHTDFLFAVIAEELGLIGVTVVILLFTLLVVRMMVIGKQAMDLEKPFAAYLTYGIAFWFAIQAVINIGVSSGVLPTKGLTLPLMSYGGTSLMVSCIAMGLLFRVDFENRKVHFQQLQTVKRVRRRR